MKCFLSLFVFFASLQLCSARLGDTLEQCEARYGLEKPRLHDKSAVLLEGARESTYSLRGWLIRVALIPATDGKMYVVRERYTKQGGDPMTVMERDAILAAENGGKEWKEVPPLEVPTPDAAAATAIPEGLKTIYRRTDGAEASMTLTEIDFQLPQAKKYEEELRSIREQKERRKLPNF